jgi:calcineurin-like phosphoesterase family protein
MWHFTADLHLDHGNIIKYCNRPFLNETEKGLMQMIHNGTIPQSDLSISKLSVDQMTNTIIDNINASVQKNDTLVICGDFCYTTRENRNYRAKQLRERINCDNVYLIWGNHDDRKTLRPLFKECYDQYMFNLDGQNIFVSHYPARSWDKAHRGSWMLYGHVHNLFWYEDHGQLSPSIKNVLYSDFLRILKNYNIEEKLIANDLLDAVADQYGTDLTVDVGVDHIRPDVPFGTPWSMDHLRTHMHQKKVKLEERKALIQEFFPYSQRKGAERNKLVDHLENS